MGRATLQVGAKHASTHVECSLLDELYSKYEITTTISYIYTMLPPSPLSAQAPPAINLAPDGWVQRQLLVQAGALEEVPDLMRAMRGSGGGVCGSGCNLVFSQAFVSNDTNASADAR